MQQNWVKKGLIYNVTGNFEWNRTHAQVPIVDVLNNERLRIYYATRDVNGKSRTSFVETSLEKPNEILYEHPNPILDLGPLGAFDDSGIMPTSILSIDDTTKFLYYIGWTTRGTVPYSNAIGLAISKDQGKSFQKYSEGPIIGVGPKEPFFTGTCYVLKLASEYIAYYLSCTGWIKVAGKLEPTYDLKIATSRDAIYWKQSGEVAIPLEQGEGGIASASVVALGPKFHMWFSVRGDSGFRENKENSYRIGYAESDDGYHWKRVSNSILSPSKSDWDSTMLAYPNVVLSDQKLWLFYNGNGFGKSGFGYAELNIR